MRISLYAVNKQTVDHLCGPIMRLNCCCDSDSTTRRSRKKGSISSVVVMRCRRVQRSEARGQGVGRGCHCFGKSADLPSTRMGGLRFRIFPPWDTFSKKCVFRHCIFRICVDGWPKWCKTCAFSCGRPLYLLGPSPSFLARQGCSYKNLTSCPDCYTQCKWSLFYYPTKLLRC